MGPQHTSHHHKQHQKPLFSLCFQHIRSMFGLIVAGRLVRTHALLPRPALTVRLFRQQVDTVPVQTDVNQFVFTVPQADAVNHFVVFLTGAEPLPEGYSHHQAQYRALC